MTTIHWSARLGVSLTFLLSGIAWGDGLPRALGQPAALSFQMAAAIAQTRPACTPPQQDEHLVLVVQRESIDLDDVRALLPDGSTTAQCQYLDDAVVRVGGFASELVATAWGDYLAQTLETQTAIVRPATALNTPEAPVNPPTTPERPAAGDDPSTASRNDDTLVPSQPSYAPQVLGSGYAVLVDYADQPEVARAVQALMGEPVSLVVYRQIPYLMATYTASASDAGDILTTLTAAEFDAVLVDSRSVIQITPAVAIAP